MSRLQTVPFLRIGSGHELTLASYFSLSKNPSAKLENCILAANSVVEEKCNLKDCDVAAFVRVSAGTNTKGEKFDE